MSEDAENVTATTELAPGDVTDFLVVLAQHDKGRSHIEATEALHECVGAALATGKKGSSLKVTVKVEPLESGAVRLVVDVVSSPVKEPAGSIWYADGEGGLSRDNNAMFYSR